MNKTTNKYAKRQSVGKDNGFMEFMNDLIYQGIKFLIYDYYTTERGELRKKFLLSNVEAALNVFYGMVGYKEKDIDRLTNESLNIIKENDNFTDATTYILANNMLNSIFSNQS
jgi:hypothetical protein